MNALQRKETISFLYISQLVRKLRSELRVSHDRVAQDQREKERDPTADTFF